jgi:predicted secreted hydrolase
MKLLSFQFVAERKWLRIVGAVLVVYWLAHAVGAAEFPLTTPDGFAVPQPGQAFVFPRDHGSHPEYSIEWWYVTGHLFTTNQAEFGFQATFFRRALALPGATNDALSSTFGNDQLYLAHMALVDRTSGIFRHQERLNRSGWDAASATNTLAVRNGNWQLHLNPEKSGDPGHEVIELQATVGADVAMTLTFTPKKPLVVFGTNGVSRKAADLTAASHYLTFSRLATTGTLTVDETNLPVTGEAWMDHEFSSSQLGQGQIGWDWLCLQLFDGRELMAYRMRRADGQTDPFSTVAWVDAQAVVRQTGPGRFKWTALQHWHSPHSGAEYPSLVQLEADNPVTGKTETFLVQPIVADQELGGQVGAVVYWEGACEVLDANHQKIGRAYMELTGYGESMNGKF